VIHARSKKDGYKPPAYWEEIAKAREAVKAKVIANGDIFTVADYWRCREVSGCDDVMIGRGLVARPDLARQIRASQRGESIELMTWPEALALVQEYGCALQGWLEDKYVTGRIKQWMNYLRQGFSEAEALWPQARKIREVTPMFEFLNHATAVDQRLFDCGQQQGVANSLN
jgi:tRNA-dihydrouridine synthase C